MFIYFILCISIYVCITCMSDAADQKILGPSKQESQIVVNEHVYAGN